MSKRHSARSSETNIHAYPALQIRPSYKHYSPDEARAQAASHLSPTIRTDRPNARAVIIGINYFGQKGEMKGRVDEARNLYNYLQQCKGYAKEDIVLLTDDQMGQWGQPIRKNIVAALQWLSEKAYPGEKILFYYSGHGRINARGIAEESKPGVIGSDSETIFPADFRQKGEISPPEFEGRLNEAQRRGAKLTFILDTHTAGFERQSSGSQSPKSSPARSPKSSSARTPKPKRS